MLSLLQNECYHKWLPWKLQFRLPGREKSTGLWESPNNEKYEPIRLLFLHGTGEGR